MMSRGLPMRIPGDVYKLQGEMGFVVVKARYQRLQRHNRPRSRRTC